MADNEYGSILAGESQTVRDSWNRFRSHPVDWEWLAPEPAWPANETTLARPFQVTGPGTFFGEAQRTLHFEPSERRGWWFDRTTRPESMPIHVSADNVWTTVRNIVLCSGSPHNYMRMVEHIIALRTGLRLDNVLIRVDSGDPPLFDRSSMDMVEGVDAAGVAETATPASYCTVKEPVTVGGRNGSFLTFLPAEEGSRSLTIDCAIDFPSAIGKQRIRFNVTPETFRYGAQARTNTTMWMMLYSWSIGKIFADTRNLGYTLRNILVAGPRRYVNKPRLHHNGKSLEAAWHRATLDLLAVIAMINKGRFVGRALSYKSGHELDVRMIRELYERDLLRPV